MPSGGVLANLKSVIVYLSYSCVIELGSVLFRLKNIQRGYSVQCISRHFFLINHLFCVLSQPEFFLIFNLSCIYHAYEEEVKDENIESGVSDVELPMINSCFTS